MSHRRFILFAASLAVAAGCCPCRKYQRLYGVPLAGTLWRLVQFDGREVDDPEGRFTLRFDSGQRLSGRSGCNGYEASCRAEPGGRLHVGTLVSTQTACPDAEREEAFLDMLRQAFRYELDARMLILSDSLRVRAVFEAADATPDAPRSDGSDTF